MVMPPLECVVERWNFYEAKATGNPKKPPMVPSVRKLSNPYFQKQYHPLKQLTAIETVTRENTQVLSYVNWFLKAIGKTTSSMEQLLQQTAHNMSKECEQLLSHLQMQTSCLISLDKALETVTDLYIALICNLQSARRDSILSLCSPPS